MTDQLERDLTALFHERATSTDAPPVPLQRLIREGEAAAATRRRRTRLAVAGAVAAAVVIAVAVPYGVRQLAHDDSMPGPADVPEVVNTSTERADSIEDLPVGPDPVVPYVVDDTLHFRGDTYSVPVETARQLRVREQPLQMQSAGETVVVVTEERQADPPGRVGSVIHSVAIPRDGELVEMLEVASPIPPLLSVDGSMLAVISQDRGITTYAVPSGERIGEVPNVPARTQVEIPSVDSSGRVLWNGRPPLLLSPGEKPQPVALPKAASVLTVTDDGVVVANGRELTLGTVADDGGFDAESSITLPSDSSALMQSGSPVVWQTPYLALDPGWIDAPGVVLDLTTGGSTELLVPEDIEFSMERRGITALVGLEGGQNVLFHGFTGGVRCSLKTGACDRILADLPEHASVTFGGQTSVHDSR